MVGIAKSMLPSVVLVILYLSTQVKGKNYTFEIYLKDPHPTKPDENLWRTELLPSDKTYYIIGYEPIVTKKVAHHLILLTCTKVVKKKDGWHCDDEDQPYLYAWARGAPALFLPPGVGFKFGKGVNFTGIQLGVHFKDLGNVTGVDMSHIGARVTYTDEPQPKEAGVFLLRSSGHIEPNTTERIDVACDIEEDVKMHIFAFRTHSHQLGKVMSGYVVKHDSDDQMDWNLIGKKNPLLPQFFYPTTTEVIAEKGDTLAARCTMFNFKNHTVTTGSRDEDEMCNFYFMFWVEDGKFPANPDCGSPGPPEYRWDNDPQLINIPSDSDNSRDEDEMCNFYFMFWVEDGKFPANPDCGSPGPPKYRWDNDPQLTNIPSDSDTLRK